MIICEKCGSEKDNKNFCKNCKKIYDQERYRQKRDKILTYQKEYDSSHKDEIAEYHKQWYQDNKMDILKKQRVYKKRKYATDIIFKLKTICSNAIYQAMKSSKNGSSILNYLPYTMEELKRHLENQFDNKMNWDNYGIYWQIDHIIPQSKLPYSSMEDDNFKKCWPLSNLRPLEASANRKKQNKII